MMKKFTIILLIAALLSSPAMPVSGDSWLTPQMAEAAARELNMRMHELGYTPLADETQIMAGARKTIAVLWENVESYGASGISELAPTFPALKVPKAGKPVPDLMGRYNLCYVAFMRQFRDPALREDADAMITATYGLTAMTMVSGYLRRVFVDNGGDVEEIKGHLSEARQIQEGIFNDPDIRAHVEHACQPVVNAFVSKPILKLVLEASQQ